MTTGPAAPLGYYWGDDAWSAGRGPEALAKRLAGDGPPLERVRLSGNSTTVDQVSMLVATATLFGGGTLVVVHEPGRLLRATETEESPESAEPAESTGKAEPLGARGAAEPKPSKGPMVSQPAGHADSTQAKGVVSPKPGEPPDAKTALARLLEVLGEVAPGNGLAFVETIDGSAKPSATLSKLRAAVAAAGGEVREFKSPRSGDMPRWIGARAAELGIRISPEAVELLAKRVGAAVTENDIDRRRQGELVMSELAKLAIYRLEGTIGPEDVMALVSETIPPSVYAFTDAVGMRLVDRAAKLAEDLADKPAPVLIAILHRRIRELAQIGDLLANGASAATIVEKTKLNPYRAELLARQARCWALPELDAALTGLLEMDAAFKAREGGSEARRKAALTLWIAEKVRRRG